MRVYLDHCAYNRPFDDQRNINVQLETSAKLYITEVALKTEAINLLTKTFGVLETERFITGIKSSKFDYTEWQKNLWNDKSVEELHEMATAFERQKHKTESDPMPIATQR